MKTFVENGVNSGNLSTETILSEAVLQHLEIMLDRTCNDYYVGYKRSVSEAPHILRDDDIVCSTRRRVAVEELKRCDVQNVTKSNQNQNSGRDIRLAGDARENMRGNIISKIMKVVFLKLENIIRKIKMIEMNIIQNTGKKISMLSIVMSVKDIWKILKKSMQEKQQDIILNRDILKKMKNVLIASKSVKLKCTMMIILSLSILNGCVIVVICDYIEALKRFKSSDLKRTIKQHLEQVITNALPRLSPTLAMIEPKFDRLAA